MKVGVCLFDEKTIPQSGWASIAGEDSFRIQNINELSSNVLWVTNIPYLTFKRLFLFKLGHLYDEQYFRVKLKTLAGEISNEESEQVVCSKLSLVLSNTLKLAQALLGFKDTEISEYRFSNFLRDILVTGQMRNRPFCNGESYEIQNAIKQATQENQAMTGRFQPEGKVAYTFKLPRTPFVHYLLSQKIPSKTHLWEPLTLTKGNGRIHIGVSDNVKLKATDAFISRISEIAETKCILLNVSVSNMEESRSFYSSFGAGFGRKGSNNGVRQWASFEEVVELSKYSKVSIANGFMTPAGRLNLDAFSSLIDDVSFSTSKGLLLENILTAIASPLFKDNKGDTVSAIGCFLRSHDRIICGRLAKIFEDNSYCVGSYGMGTVMVYLSRADFKSARSLALENGLIPTLSCFNL